MGILNEFNRRISQQIISRDDLMDILDSQGASDTWGELDINDLKEITGVSDQWKLEEVSLDNFPDILADPEIINENPIVTTGPEYGWEILDGKHRVGSAKARGEKAIMAYLPVV